MDQKVSLQMLKEEGVREWDSGKWAVLAVKRKNFQAHTDEESKSMQRCFSSSYNYCKLS